MTAEPTTASTSSTAFGTLATRFDPRRNSLNALRLVLAALVIVSHSWPLFGYEPEPHLGGANLGVWAVLGFFAISGFLVTRSRLRSAPLRYYRARALRILPAFVLCLFVVAFLFAPLSLVFDPTGSWSASNAFSFVLRNLALYPPYLFQGGIEGTLTTTPFLGLWDGPLWTLFWEACCYIAIGVTVSLVPKARLAVVLSIAFGMLTAASLADALGFVTLPELISRVTPLFIAFIAGALVLLFADRIRVSALTLGIALVALIVTVVLGLVQQLGTLPLAFLVLAISTLLPLSKIGTKYDISYGIYIYGWPVQQILALAMGEVLPLPVLILLAIALTVPLAFLSCVLVERPALKLKPKASVPAVTGQPATL